MVLTRYHHISYDFSGSVSTDTIIKNYEFFDNIGIAIRAFLLGKGGEIRTNLSWCRVSEAGCGRSTVLRSDFTGRGSCGRCNCPIPANFLP